MGSKRLLILVDGTADAMFAVDAVGRITAWNSAATELFGRNEREVLTRPCDEILQCSNDNEIFRSEQCVITRVAQDNSPLVNFDLRLQTKTGKQWCNLSTLIASDSNSGTRQTLFIVRPREMRKRLEQALNEFVRTYGRDGSNGNSIHTSINVRLTSREIEVLKDLAKVTVRERLPINSTSVRQPLITTSNTSSRNSTSTHAWRRSVTLKVSA